MLCTLPHHAPPIYAGYTGFPSTSHHTRTSSSRRLRMRAKNSSDMLLCKANKSTTISREIFCLIRTLLSHRGAGDLEQRVGKDPWPSLLEPCLRVFGEGFHRFLKLLLEFFGTSCIHLANVLVVDKLSSVPNESGDRVCGTNVVAGYEAGQNLDVRRRHSSDV